MTGGEIVARSLIEQRIDTVFGIPGALNAHLYEGLRRHQEALRHVLVRHELGGAWMADGYARAGGDVGVALTVPGPGATHAASAVAGAYTDCSRVLLISSSPESGWRGELRRDLFHGLDQQRLFASITKWQTAVTEPGQIAPALEEAFVRLRSGRPGPVHVEIPADVLGMDAGQFVPNYVAPRPQPADPAQIARAVAALKSAQRPLILAGDGVLHSRATQPLGEVARRLGAPVITTVLGKGALPDDHPQSLGDMNTGPASQAYGEADLVLAVGVRFIQVDTRWPWFRPPARLVHLDADPRELGRVYPAEVGICAELAAAVAQLAGTLEARPPERGWQDLLPALKRENETRPRDPVVAALRRALPREGVVSFDVCYAGFCSRMDWTCHHPRELFYPGCYVGMGFGLPAGIGARLARPDAPTLVVAGDGGFQMTMAELGTAVQHDVPVVVVVVNDGGLTLIRRVQDREFEGRRFAVDLVNPDFCALVAAYGIPTRRVTTPEDLETATAVAFREGRLAFIEYALPP